MCVSDAVCLRQLKTVKQSVTGWRSVGLYWPTVSMFLNKYNDDDDDCDS